MSLEKIFEFFSSLKLAVWVLSLSLVLVFFGTLAQEPLGLYLTQERFFQSFFVDYASMAAAVSAAAPNAPAGESPDAPKPEARMIVVGDSDFASNGALGIQGNRDLFLNMANWLAQQENLIAIRPTDPADRRVQLTEDQSSRIWYFVIYILPLLFVGIGIRVWWVRR